MAIHSFAISVVSQMLAVQRRLLEINEIVIKGEMRTILRAYDRLQRERDIEKRKWGVNL